MKIEIDDRPVSNHHPQGSCAIRLIPETNKEMAQLERCLTVHVKFEEFRKWAHPDQVFYGFYGLYEQSSPVSTPNDSTTARTSNQT